MTDNSRARVFISCGQTKDSDELETAHRIRDRLEEMGFDVYVAVEEQTLRGLTENIFPRLRDYEYFVFVDFKREQLVPRGRRPSVKAHRGSLFSHQELAIASYLNLPVLAFQEKGVKTDDGILKFLQTNATPFTDRKLLPNVIADQVQRRKWSSTLRNELVLERDERGQHVDHYVQPSASTVLQLQYLPQRRFYYINVRNLHDHKTAMNCYVYLERVSRLGASVATIPFGSVELKWSGYTLPNAHILPQTSRPFDAIAIFHTTPTAPGLVTFSDSMGFGYLPIDVAGEYELSYAVVSDNFPIVRASFSLNLSAKLDDTTLRLVAT
jgi:hypothetical protein